MILHFLNRNWSPILFALLTGLIIVFPQMALIIDLGENYQGINIDKTDSENYYTIRVREIYDGHLEAANPEFYEYKNEPYLQPSLSEFILAFLAKIFFLTPAQIIILGKFIFPGLLYLAIYFFSFKITKSKILSLTIPLVIIFASKIVSFPQEIFSLFNGQIFDNTTFNNYSRPIHPQFSSLIFFIWLTCLYVWLKTKRNLLFWFSAILLGLMFYIYPYSWILALAITGFIFCFAFLNIFEDSKSLRKKILLMVGIAVLISVFYWLNLFSALESPDYKIAQLHYGFFKSHQPLIGKLLILDFIVLALLFFRRKKDLNFYFFLSLLLASLAAINQQIITGLRFYPGHWHWYYTIPFSIILVLWACYYWLDRINRKIYLYIFLIATILFSLINGFLSQYSAYQNNKDTYLNYQRYGPVFKWLENNTNRDNVVLADKILRDKIIIYTHCNNYLPSNFGALYLVPHQRFLDALFVDLSLKKINSEKFYKYLTAHPTDFYDTLFSFYYQQVCHCLCYPISKVKKLKDDYQIFSTKNFEEELKKYRIDYVVWDTQINKTWNLNQYKFMDFIIEINNVRIYKVI